MHNTTVRRLKLTSKRQATFPADFCNDLNLHAGDRIVLDHREIDGKSTWLIRPESPIEASWFGVLRKYGKGKSHSMADVRRSIGRKVGERKR
jgi:bifunctional DNA-binding transcriptional regulator/antitoxin component of YhaV-PrlF toxin-antitoxin module